jgi:hypothetical protein
MTAPAAVTEAAAEHVDVMLVQTAHTSQPVKTSSSLQHALFQLQQPPGTVATMHVGGIAVHPPAWGWSASSLQSAEKCHVLYVAMPPPTPGAIHPAHPTSTPLPCPPFSGITWMTKDGLRKPNYWGSLTQAATCRVGNFCGEEVHAPFKALLPMVDPNDMVLGGWDISGMNLAEVGGAPEGLCWHGCVYCHTGSDEERHTMHMLQRIEAAGGATGPQLCSEQLQLHRCAVTSSSSIAHHAPQGRLRLQQLQGLRLDLGHDTSACAWLGVSLVATHQEHPVPPCRSLLSIPTGHGARQGAGL